MLTMDYIFIVFISFLSGMVFMKFLLEKKEKALKWLEKKQEGLNERNKEQ